MRETPPEVTGTGGAAGPAQAPGRADSVGGASNVGRAGGADGAVLACYDVTKSYGGVLAVDSVYLGTITRDPAKPGSTPVVSGAAPGRRATRAAV